jgi:Ca2+-binding RTX toxin-like protein
VTVYEGAIALGTGVADGTGTWSAAVTLSAGDHTLSVQATDRAGNVSVMSPSRAVTVGSGGNDVLFTPGAQLMGGGAGDDLYLVDDAGDEITEAVGDGSDTVLASVGYTLPAVAAIEFLFADSGAGLVLGGNDLVNTIRGGAGADTLTGGGGGDTLMGSGGVDTFRYTALSDSTAGAGHMDTILDFDAAIGEMLDLSALDADLTVGGDQAFSFIGSAAFTAAGQVRAEIVGGVTMVSGNVNAALDADFVIALTGSHTLTGAHFVL